MPSQNVCDQTADITPYGGLGVESYKKSALAIEHICSIYSDACVRRICITLIFVCKLAKAAKTS